MATVKTIEIQAVTDGAEKDLKNLSNGIQKIDDDFKFLIFMIVIFKVLFLINSARHLHLTKFVKFVSHSPIKELMEAWFFVLVLYFQTYRCLQLPSNRCKT